MTTCFTYGQTCDPCYAIVDGGNWGDVTTWSDTPGGSATNNIPDNSIDVHIGESGAITVNLGVDADANNLTIYNGGILLYTAADVRLRTRGGATLDVQIGGSISGNGQSAADLVIRGDLILDGTISGLRRIQSNYGNPVSLSGSGTMDLSTGNGELRIVGAGIVTNNISTQLNLVRLRLQNDGNTLINNGSIQCSQLRLYGSNGQLTNNGTINVTSQVISNQDTDDGNTITNTNTLTISADFNMTNADFNINNSGTLVHTGNFLNVGGTETFTNQTNGSWTTTATSHADIATINCSATDNTFIYDLAGNQDVFVPSDGSYYNLTLQNSGTKTALGSLDVDNNFTIGGTAIVEMNTNNADLNIGGNYSNSGGTFNEGTRTVTFDGSGVQTIDNTSTSETFYNLIIDNAGGSVAIGGSLTTLINQDFNLASTNSGAFSGSNTHTINGSVTIESGNGATWTAGSTINLSGNWTNNDATGDFNANNGTINFIGSSSQTIGGSASSDFYNLVLNNVNGFSLGVNTAVNNALTMTSGNVDLATFTLTLGTSAATPGTLTYTSGDLFNGSFTRYFDAATITDGNVDGLLPMGDTYGNTRPFYVTPAIAPSTGGTITVSVTSSEDAADIGPIDDNGTDIVRQHQASWNVSTGGGLAGGNDFNIRGGGTGFGFIDAVSDLRLMTSGGVVGTDGGAGGSTANPIIDRTGLTLAQLTNSFHVGSINATDSPLPIELLSFSAKSVFDQVQVEWTTAIELDNDYFTIEKSIDGIHFNEIARINGAGNSTEELTYSHIDFHPSAGVSFYRLKQTDFDGTTEIFDPVKVTSDLPNEISLFPNPLDNNLFNINIIESAYEKLDIQIFDHVGRKIQFQPNYNDLSIEITFNQVLISGIYMVSIRLDSKYFHQRLIVP